MSIDNLGNIIGAKPLASLVYRNGNIGATDYRSNFRTLTHVYIHIVSFKKRTALSIYNSSLVPNHIIEVVIIISVRPHRRLK